VLLESYWYAPGPVEAPAAHSHEEYQLGLSLDSPGEYRYRGGRHPVPVGGLSVIQSGEVHRSREVRERDTPASYRMMYVEPALLQRAAAEAAGCEASEPFFASPAVADGALVRLFVGLYTALEGTGSRLERDSRFLDVLARLVEHHADTRASGEPAGRERRAVRLAREYLEDNHAENVSLDDLAGVVNLSPYHLNRVFSREVGLPPHRYQVQVRVERAKSLLASGEPIRRVASETGFADHAHLTRHFKRLVGVPPSMYLSQNSKNVQAPGAQPGDTA